MKYKELLEQLRELTPDQLELETLVMIRDKEKFVSLKSGEKLTQKTIHPNQTEQS